MSLSTMDFNEDAAPTVEFDSETRSYRTNYENAESAPGIALVEAVAAIEETDPIELEPLGSVLDVDALDSVIGTMPSGPETLIAVSYEGYHAMFHGDGSMELKPIDSDTGDAAE